MKGAEADPTWVGGSMSERATCVLCPNPSPMTLDGTNTWIVAEPGSRDAVVIDPGPLDEAHLARVIAEVEQTGRRVALTLLTHGHLDHAGLGGWWQARGAPVAIGADDARLVREPHFTSPLEMEAFARYVEESGAPRDITAEVRTGLEARRQWARAAATAAAHFPARATDRWPTALRFLPFSPARLLGDGDSAGAGLRVVVCPGHTPGNLVLGHEDEGLLFSGDQLLPYAICAAVAGRPKPT